MFHRRGGRAVIDREIEQILPEVAAALGITIEQTRCVVDGFESQGLSFADVVRGDGNPAITEAMAVLTPQRTGAVDSSQPLVDPALESPAPESPAPQPAASDTATSGPAPGASIYDTPAFRESMIAGIAADTGEPPEVAACILDDTLSQGLTMDDLVLRGGGEDVVAAITDAAVGCVAG